jgi:hypothetical protein
LAEFGRNPSPELYEQLFDPEDETVLHPGMKEPLPPRNVGAYMAGVLATLQNFRFETIASCACGDLVFAEASSTAVAAAGGSRETGRLKTGRLDARVSP